jgi:quercetin dioxygenase-like cupin family protein
MPEQPRAPETTSGADAREPRTLMQPIETFDLDGELQRLTSEPEWTGRDRNAVTLAKATNFRVVLVVLRAGAEVGEDEAHGPISVQVIRGSAAVRRAGQESELGAGRLATLDSGGAWAISAREDSAVLLTIAWPEERSLV